MFYLTDDDEFIIKTVLHKEADFLQKLLPGYYMVSKIHDKNTQETNYYLRFIFQNQKGKIRDIPNNFECSSPEC